MGGASEWLDRPGKRTRAAVVEFVRYVKPDEGDEETTDRPPPEPEELIDGRLLSLFPGRTLEELDRIDLNRLHRALIARHMEQVEQRRQLFLKGKLKAEDIDADDWNLIREMDAIANELGL